jgi:hypothetical protein
MIQDLRNNSRSGTLSQTVHCTLADTQKALLSSNIHITLHSVDACGMLKHMKSIVALTDLIPLPSVSSIHNECTS